MKIKYMFILPTVATCLAFGSTSCYGNNSGKSGHQYRGSDTQTNTQRHPSSTDSQIAASYSSNGSSYSGNSNGYGSNSSNYTNKHSNGSSYGTGTNSTSKGSGYSTSTTPAAPYTNGGNQCSTMDISVFEESDEESVYNDHGFTRGDIKNLYTYKYDPKSEQTIKGTVVKILRVQFPDNNCYLIAVLSTDRGNVLANLGPVWFADENNMVVNEGDQIDVSGSVIRTNGRYIIIAGQLKKAAQSLQLRNQSGNPQWGTAKSQKGTQGVK